MCVVSLVMGVVGFARVLEIFLCLFGRFRLHRFRFLPSAAVGVTSLLMVAALCGVDVGHCGWFWGGVGREVLFERVLLFLSRACSSSRLIVLKVMTLERWSKKSFSKSS